MWSHYYINGALQKVTEGGQGEGARCSPPAGVAGSSRGVRGESAKSSLAFHGIFNGFYEHVWLGGALKMLEILKPLYIFGSL